MCKKNDDEKRLQKRRELDAEVTKEFLAANKDKVEKITKAFSEKISAKGTSLIEKFYLKGGRAISILQGEESAGSDYDFQLVPQNEVYNNWISGGSSNQDFAFADLDSFIIRTLVEVTEVWKGEPDDCIDIWKKRCAEEGQGEENAPTAITNLVKIGKGYRDKSYTQIRSDPNFQVATGRLELPKNDDTFDIIKPEQSMNGLYVYVNYTIPGFILYRLVKSYMCKVPGEKKKMPIKSEIIDVSVPRPGSAERFLSQDEVITYFRDKDGFHIPGWGYHFYENINLLQEVSLGYSGSPHKEKKRWERLRLSIEELKKVNGKTEMLFGGLMKEPCDKGEKEILGYSGALLYGLTVFKELDNKVTPGNPIYQALLEEYKIRIQTVTIQNGNDFAKACVALGVKRMEDTRLPLMERVKDEFLTILKNASVPNPEFPLPVAKDDKFFYGKYFFSGIESGVFQKIQNNAGKNDMILSQSGNILCYKLRNTGGTVVYVLFYRNDQKEQITVQELLERTILFSQRNIWQRYLEKR